MKILFLCPDYFGIYRVIEDGIRRNTDCELTSVIFEDYKYKNPFEKAANFISKFFLKRNLKKKWASKERLKSVPVNSHFDFIFVICPDFMREEDLSALIAMSDKSIVYYWDSFANIPKYKRTVHYFDKGFTFERDDAAKYKLDFLTNFYYSDFFRNDTDNDVFYIGTLDSRIHIITKILEQIEQKNRSAKIYLQTKKRLIGNFSNKIHIIRDVIPFGESEKICMKSRIILDVQKPIQKGLTFRVFEALGKGKKLITTNGDIVNYDFYDPNNIFIWTEDSIEIPDAFFDTPYKKLPEHIYRKYSLDNWVRTIFNINQ